METNEHINKQTFPTTSNVPTRKISTDFMYAIILCVIPMIIGYVIILLVPQFSDNIIALFEWADENFILSIFFFYFLDVLSKLLCITLMYQGLIPGLLLTKRFGFISGLFFGIILGILSNYIAGMISFYISRKYLRNFKKIFAERPILKAFDVIMEFEGKLFSFLLRISKFFPIFILNYLFPLTKLSFVDYSFGFIGILPWILAEYMLGYILEDISNLFNEHKPNFYINILFFFGIFIQIITFIIIIFITRRKFNHYKLATSKIADSDIISTPTNFDLKLKIEEKIQIPKESQNINPI